MRLIRLATATDGVVLGQDVRTGRPHELPLLRAGVRLSSSMIERLQALGIHAVWIEDALSEGIEPLPPLDPETRAAAETAVSKCFERTARSLAGGQTAMPAQDIAELSSVASLIAERLADVPEASLALDDLATADAYTHRHSVQVAIIGLLIARRHWRRHGWVDYRGQHRHDRFDELTTKLGVGLMVHDIGKLAVPPEILQKPGALTDEEFEQMKLHPRAGVELLSSADPSPLILAAVRDHHERLDGSGYPAGRSGREIHAFARICAIADVYDAVSSERPYKPADPPHVAVNVINRGVQSGGFDPELAETFRHVCLPFPLGCEIDAGDGRTGVVCHVDPEEPWLPTARVQDGPRIEEQDVDLRHLDATRTPAP